MSGQFVCGEQSKISSQMSILIEIFRLSLPTPCQITQSKREEEEGKFKGVGASKSVCCLATQIWLPEKIEDTH